MPNYIHKTTCRVCESADLVEILDLGATPPANAYLEAQELAAPEQKFPLKLYFCRTCTLAQLLDVVNPELLFKGYHFLTSASDPSVKHFQDYAASVIKPLITSPDDLVVDIGGNDGTLLGFVKDYARVLNVDPADNMAPLSESKGVPFHAAFFSSNVADTLLERYGEANIVVANNVFAHTDPIRDVFSGVSKLIGEKGTFIFEVHWAKNLVDEGCFDQIYHEHLCFYSLHALNHLVEKVGMKIFDVEIVPMQGQSLRVYVAKNRELAPRVEAILQEEKKAGLTSEKAYQGFAKRVQENKEQTVALLKKLKAEGKKIMGYGAPAKSNTLLNFYGIGRETLDYLTDTTSLKQGLYSPGTHIPIMSPDILQTEPPEYILLLAWNFKDAILKKEQRLRDQGVKFIIPIPRIEVV